MVGLSDRFTFHHSGIVVRSQRKVIRRQLHGRPAIRLERIYYATRHLPTFRGGLYGFHIGSAYHVYISYHISLSLTIVSELAM
jgi:hypothetical protein